MELLPNYSPIYTVYIPKIREILDYYPAVSNQLSKSELPYTFFLVLFFLKNVFFSGRNLEAFWNLTQELVKAGTALR